MSSTSKSKPISISLPPVMLKEMSRRIEGGLYSSTSELIREALRFYFAEHITAGSIQTTEGGNRIKSALELGDLSNKLEQSMLTNDPSAHSQRARTKLLDIVTASQEDNVLKISEERLRKLKAQN